jgi:hypothetical protein
MKKKTAYNLFVSVSWYQKLFVSSGTVVKNPPKKVFSHNIDKKVLYSDGIKEHACPTKMVENVHI